jgi:hypothetical protein
MVYYLESRQANPRRKETEEDEEKDDKNTKIAVTRTRMPTAGK